MKRLLVILLVAFELTNSHGQNLVQNPSFENFTNCPSAFAEIAYAIGWDSFSETCDYYNSCTASSWSTPTNIMGYQVPHSGNAYAGIITYTKPGLYREVIGGNLTSPLIIGQKYNISFFVSLTIQPPNCAFACNKIGAKFTTVAYNAFTNQIPINNIAPLHFDTIITDTTNWQLITSTFIADSAYTYIAIGNFFDDANIDTLRIGNGFVAPIWAYYYIDDVSLTAQLTPLIKLSCTDTIFCEKKCIDFYDLSTNNPTSWQWYFPGADSTASTLQNPTNICYNSYGSFDVTLIACNAAGCDTLFLPDFINEYQTPTPTITQSNDTLFSSPGVAYQWWNVDSGIIGGATNNYFMPTQGGDYFVIVTDSIGCAGASNVLSITGIKNLFQHYLEVRPNPFTNILTFKLNNNQTSQITLYDITLRMILSQHFTTSTTINTSQLAKGIYLYEVRNKNGVISKGKVVKD